jgi:ATP-binding cassette subfamily B protein
MDGRDKDKPGHDDGVEAMTILGIVPARTTSYHSRIMADDDQDELPRKKRGDLRALKLVLPFLWPRDDPKLRFGLVVSLVMLGVTASANALVPILFALAVDRLTAKGDALLVAPIALLLSYGFMQWLQRVLNEGRWLHYGPVEQRMSRTVALTVFRHINELSLRYHLSRRTGALARYLDAGIKAVENLLFNSVFVILPILAEVAIICAVLLGRYDAAFTAIIVATLVLYCGALVVGSEKVRVHQRRANVANAEAMGKAVDAMLNYETVKYFGNEGHVARRYDASLREVERLHIKNYKFLSYTGIVQMTVIGIGMTLLVVLAALRVESGAMTVGGFVLVNTYLLQLMRPVERLGQLYRSIKQELVETEQMLSLLDRKPEIVDAPDARPLPAGPGEIRFDNVSFAYDPRRPILTDISFVVPPGATTAIVGPSGAGKSTIARLLFRFYDPTIGRVSVDGADAREVTQDSLHAAVAVVPQDSVLFNESVLYNLEFGRPGAPRAEIEDAARLAEIHDFIVSTPDGYETVVGERGLKLSGGEKQRVAIARAVLKRPRIYVFDEATSSLDSHTERAIQDNLRKVSHGVTTVMIAHRLSTIIHADEILFLDDGRIVERGTHDALLAANGPYAALWRRQLEARNKEGPDLKIVTGGAT